MNTKEPTVDQIVRHYRKLARGEIHPDANGWFYVDMSDTQNKNNVEEQTPKYEIISPTQQTVQIAKSELKQKPISNEGNDIKRNKKRSQQPKTSKQELLSEKRSRRKNKRGTKNSRKRHTSSTKEKWTNFEYNS